MKIKILLVCFFTLFLGRTYAQQRDYIEYSYDLYQLGSASYEISDNGTTLNNLDDVQLGHFLYDLSIRFDNYYFRLDASGIAGTFMDNVISNTDKNFLQTTHIGIGLLTTNSPIQITENSDLVLGITGFIDSAYLSLKEESDKVDFGTFGYSLILDYQLSDQLNVFAEYARGKRKTTGGENTMRSFRVRGSYNIFNSLYLTGTLHFKKYSESEATELNEVKASTFSFGILLK